MATQAALNDAKEQALAPERPGAGRCRPPCAALSLPDRCCARAQRGSGAVNRTSNGDLAHI